MGNAVWQHFIWPNGWIRKYRQTLAENVPACMHCIRRLEPRIYILILCSLSKVADLRKRRAEEEEARRLAAEGTSRFSFSNPGRFVPTSILTESFSLSLSLSLYIYI